MLLESENPSSGFGPLIAARLDSLVACAGLVPLQPAEQGTARPVHFFAGAR